MITEIEAYNLLNEYIKSKKDFTLPINDEVVCSGLSEDGKYNVTYTFKFLIKRAYGL